MARGRVVDFDPHRGLGTVEALDGSRLTFHVSAIADGSRHIEVGAHVEYAVCPGHLGDWEAAELVVVDPKPRAD